MFIALCNVCTPGGCLGAVSCERQLPCKISQLNCRGIIGSTIGTHFVHTLEFMLLLKYTNLLQPSVLCVSRKFVCALTSLSESVAGCKELL